MNVVYCEDDDLAVFNGVKFRKDKITGYYLNSSIQKKIACVYMGIL